jgi:hypothetical protein
MSDRPSGGPPNDIYTVLVIVGGIMLVAATVILVIRSQQLFGSWNPFSGA